MLSKGRIAPLGLAMGLFLAWSVLPHTSYAMTGRKDKGKSGIPIVKKNLDDSLKRFHKYEGLFTLYQDTTTGNVLMLIKKDQIGKKFIYFGYTENGVVDAGQFRGNFQDNKIFSIRRYYNKIQFVAENTNFYFDPKSALSRSADANISPSMLASEKITYQDTAKGIYLINADNIFLTENLQPIKPVLSPRTAGEAFNLGSLSKEKTQYKDIHNYPKNTEIVVKYVYENPAPYVQGGKDIADSRFVSIEEQHTLIELPNDNFKPRFDDPRVGYFSTEVDDMTSPDATPYRDVIHRWNLVKKDKNAALSEPVEPITYWIENTTPMEFRETIKAAALSWNQAFEKAGFKNAIVVKVQPDTATWDAGDIRYNVIRWCSSPRPSFGGYGPSFVNPMTGEILGADIMLEYIFVTNRMKQDKLFQTTALDMENQVNGNNMAHHYCDLGDYLQLSTLFGLQALDMEHMSEEVKKEYIKESLYYLVLHEMGHTLGLMHNMKASQMYSPADINNKEQTEKTGLTGSVMDYPAANLALDKSKQGQYFTDKPGPYDMWAIQYGYSQTSDDPAGEESYLNKLLSRSSESALAFGNDADDMRSPGSGIDPRVMIGDMSSDAITYSVDRFKLVDKLAVDLKKNYTAPGHSYQELLQSYLILTGEYATAARVISRYIGGVYVDRSFVGQAGAGKPYTPVAEKDQRRAMEALTAYMFSPTAFNSSDELYSYLQRQRRGYGFFGKNEDPHIYERVLNMQKEVLDQLLHPNVMARITDSRTYGNTYTLNNMLSDLTNGIFIQDLGGKVNVFRQNLQIEYVNHLAGIVKTSKDKYDNHSQAMAFAQLKSIQKMMITSPGTDPETQAHRKYILHLIDAALSTNG